MHTAEAPGAFRSLTSVLSFGQGLYLVVTGLWPMVHMKSFLAITGPKRDLWLVNTVGAVVTAVGSTLVLAGLRGKPSAEIAVLGAGSAAALASVDVVYAARRTISPIYLLEAAVEAMIIAAWAVLSFLRLRRR